MKKILALLFVALATPAFADFTVNLDAGRLRLSLGSSMPLNSVLVLVAAGPDGVFSNTLGAGQFASGDDILLSILSVPNSAGAFNISGGTDETLNTLTISTTSLPPLTLGNLLALRWFPQITKAQFLGGTTPVAGNNFGTYNPLFWGNGSNNPDLGDAWAVPSPGSTISLNFFTILSDGGGSQPDSRGYAQFTVVPEPTSFALAGVALLGAAAFRFRKRRS